MSGLHHIIRFDMAVMLHTFAALALILLWVFAIFWHLTTGQWRHYTPTTNGLLRVIRFYIWGVFKGERHPYRKAYWRKHNPLQAVTYMLLKLVVFPAIWISGIAYLTYNLWADSPAAAGSLSIVAGIHVISAFVIAAFVVAHVYLLTAGHSFREHVKPMISGYEKIDLTPEEEAYLQLDEPGRIHI